MKKIRIPIPYGKSCVSKFKKPLNSVRAIVFVINVEVATFTATDDEASRIFMLV